MHRMIVIESGLLMALATAAGCDDRGQPAESTTTPEGDVGSAADPEATWHRDVRPVVERRCVACHVEGGAAPFTFASYADAQEHGWAMVAAVEARVMPPWPMDPTCRDVQEERILSDDERAVFAAWRDAGFAEGDPEDFVPPADDGSVEHPPADVVLTPSAPYVPDRGRPDDYRCLPYPQAAETDLNVIGTNVLPDAAQVVHHVLLFVVPPERSEDLDRLADNDGAGPGYTCYGGTGVPGSELIGGWAPGAVPRRYPPGAAFPVAEGSRFVAQIHYNTLAVGAEEAIPADRTEVELWTMPAGETPTDRVRIRALAQLTLDIPAGESHVVMEKTVTSPYSETIIGTVPHMHLLGKSIEVTLERPDGETECLSRVPKWDFDWQQTYGYEPEDYVVARTGDRLTIRCIYDNSAEHQPTVNGAQQAPRDVTWGEGTLDEMCLNYLVTLSPVTEDEGDGQCEGARGCVAACPEEEPTCAMDCLLLSGQGCVGCAIQPVYVQCAPRHCPVEISRFGQCMQACDGSTFDCAFGICKTEYDTLWGCFAPHVAGGACDDFTAACGLTMGE